MEKVKESIKGFTSRTGHNDTTVHETVAPAVQHETVKPHEHEEVNVAVDKEVHQDHYHRTVQPVHDREVLPEKHTANLGAVQHREFDERDHDATKRALATEQSGFRDERNIEGTTHSQSAAAVVGGEHKHHHVHETIQPVVHKETVQPSVVHTTVPIHETHHKSATHHGTSALPAVSLGEFKERGGVLGGREERYDAFEGEPKNIGGKLAGALGHSKHDSHHTNESTRTAAQHGDVNPSDGKLARGTGNVAEYETGRSLGQGGARGVGNDLHGRDTTGTSGLTGTSGTGAGLGSGVHDRGVGHDSHNRDTYGKTGSGLTGNSGTTGGSGFGVDERGIGTGVPAKHGQHNAPVAGREPESHSKPGLMDKLNPRVDADGDGKAGMMD